MAFYFSLKRLFDAKHAMLFTFLYCTIPQVTNFATIGYGDLALTLMITMGFIFLFQYFDTRRNSFLTLAAVFSGIGVLTKNEGIAFSISSFLIIAIVVIKEGNKLENIKKLFIYYLLPFAVVISPWIYFKNLLGVHNTDIDISQVSPATLLENAKQIPFILNKFQQEIFGPKKWNILWIMVVSFVFLRFNRLKEAKISRIGLFILFNMGIYFASYMLLTGKDLFFHVNTTLSRFMIHFTGIGLFLLSYLAYNDIKNIFEGD
jgi:4-amino-4-deoxy-L-arabinose transferase-like glycosyltransferase